MTFLAGFLIHATWPMFFFIIYIYCSNLLKTQFGYTPEEIIQNSFYVSIPQIIGTITVIMFSCKYHPLNILKWQFCITFPVLLLVPLILQTNTSALHLLILQSYLALVCFCDVPACPIILRHLAVLKRFTSASIIYALSRALTYLITSFGTIYLTESFSHWGLLFIIIPICSGYVFAVLHFQKLEDALKITQTTKPSEIRTVAAV